MYSENNVLNYLFLVECFGLVEWPYIQYESNVDSQLIIYRFYWVEKTIEINKRHVYLIFYSGEITKKLYEAVLLPLLKVIFDIIKARVKPKRHRVRYQFAQIL